MATLLIRPKELSPTMNDLRLVNRDKSRAVIPLQLFPTMIDSVLLSNLPKSLTEHTFAVNTEEMMFGCVSNSPMSTHHILMEGTPLKCKSSL